MNKNSAPQKFFKTPAFQKCAILIICLLGIIIYSNTFHASFHFDDEPSIFSNPAIRNLRNLKAIWDFNPTRFFAYLSLAFNYRLHRLSLPGYHLFNLAVHLGASMLVCWLALLVLSSPKVKDYPVAGHAKLISLLAGLIFAAHPIQTQAVTYIIQRTASLAAFFYLLSVCCYLKARLKQTQKPDFRCWLRFYAGSILAAFAAFFTKEFSVTLPFMLLLCEVSLFRDDYKKVIKHLAPFFLLLLLVLTTIKITGSESRSLQEFQASLTAVTPVQYLLTQFLVIVTYLRLLLLPVNQNLDYDYPIAQTLWQTPVLISFLLLLLILAAAVILFRKHRLLSFSIFWFFLTLAPESSIFPIRDVIFEHRLYLPMAGYSIFLPTGFYCLFGEKRLKPMVAALLAVVTCYSVMAYTRNRVWRDEITLWSDVAAKSPNKARSFSNLGTAYAYRGRYQEAIDACKQAIRIKPDIAETYNNLGVAYTGMGRHQEAIDACKQALRLKPDYAEAHNTLGAIYYKLSLYQEALDAYKQAVRIIPYYAKAHYNLGLIYEKLGRYQEALDAYKQAVSISPDFAEAHFGLGLAYLFCGDNDSALNQYKILKNLNSGFTNELFNLIVEKGK